MNYLWDFASIFSYWDVLLAGIWATLKLFTLTIVLGLCGGLIVGMLRYAHIAVLRYPAAIFTELFRNTPVLVQIIWFYFALPVLIPFDISPFIAAALGITLNTIAFSSEIFRGGIQSIERGQWEAAKAVGMNYIKTMSRIILPQAIKRMLPPLTNRAIEVFKISTLASVISYPETLHQAKLIASLEFNPIEAYSTVAILFFIILYPVVQATYVLERRFKKGD